MGEAATHYFSSLPPGTAAPAQQEVFKFIRWYGEERPVINLTGQEVANYAEQFGIATTKSAEHLHAIKTFLSFAHKQGVSPQISPHTSGSRNPQPGALPQVHSKPKTR